MPQEERLALIRADDLTEDSMLLLLHGMENLVSALAEVMGYADNGDEEVRH